MEKAGLVVARYRRHVTVEDESGKRHICQLGSRKLSPLAGDEVRWRADAQGRGTVAAVLPRRSTLTRVNSRGRPEAVAANLSQLVVVVAPQPAPDWLNVDRYLCAAELGALKSAVVLNKTDLAGGPLPTLAIYERIGYPVHATSALRARGLGRLAAAMRGERSAVVGQSGVGKSALINALLGDAVQPTGELTGKGGHGRHTTSTAVLYRLAGGGELIDSPGVRNFAPYIEDRGALQHGFRELTPYAGRCRFDDCRHLEEPDCAIKAALAAGAVSAQRYASYRALHALTASRPRERREP